MPEEGFEEIAVIDSHLEREFPEDKLGILDVLVLTESGKRIDIEIQLYAFPFLPERITFYTCKNLTGQIASGESYEVIRKTITIVVLDFPLIVGSSYHHCFKLYDPKNGVQFTDVLEIHTLELPKLPPEADDEDLLLSWLRLFKAQRLEEYDMLATKDPTLKKTVDILKRLSADDKTRLIYEAREKARRDEIAKMRGARTMRAKKRAGSRVKLRAGWKAKLRGKKKAGWRAKKRADWRAKKKADSRARLRAGWKRRRTCWTAVCLPVRLPVIPA
jgi:predicted transposase/invertase (TIGR01784 family)